MTELDFESDAFLELLTDALRAGPGSPAWHEALRRLRSGGIESADEYRLLVTAREHLESGREYRSVRAGPGFAERLMAEIEQEAARAARTPATSTTIAVASAGAMLIVLLAIGYLLWTAVDEPGDGTRLLTNTVATVDFSGTLPSDWQFIGPLRVELTRGQMRVSPTTAAATEPSVLGGGVVWQRAIDPAEPFSVVTGLRIFRPEEDLLAQVFVTDQPDFSADSATTPHELVWTLRSNRTQVILPGQRVEALLDLSPEELGRMILLRLTIDRDQAIVELGGRRLWAGSSGLDPARPRFVGVRFLRRASGAGEGVAFQNVRVNMRQQ